MGLINIVKPLSTFLRPAQSTYLSDIKNKIRRIDPEAAESEALTLPLCYAAPTVLSRCRSVRPDEHHERQRTQQVSDGGLDQARVLPSLLLLLSLRVSGLAFVKFSRTKGLLTFISVPGLMFCQALKFWSWSVLKKLHIDNIVLGLKNSWCCLQNQSLALLLNHVCQAGGWQPLSRHSVSLLESLDCVLDNLLVTAV